MTLLHCRVRYTLNGLWVHPDVLGWEHSYQADGATVTLKLPTGADSFTARDFEKELMPVPSVVLASTYNEPGRYSRTASVQLFMVQAEFDAPLDGERPQSIVHGEPYWVQADDACKHGQPICDNAAHDFLRWLRTTSQQPWLGLLSEQPHQYGRAGLRYADGREVMGFGPTWAQRFQSSRLRLEQADLRTIGQKVEAQEPVPVTSELLSDARYLDEGSGTPDLKRGSSPVGWCTKLILRLGVLFRR